MFLVPVIDLTEGNSNLNAEQNSSRAVSQGLSHGDKLNKNGHELPYHTYSSPFNVAWLSNSSFVKC